MAKEGRTPTAHHNNGSGKHMGMLTTARHLGAEIEGYEAARHPIQIKVRHTLSEMTGYNLEGSRPAIDGCSAPAYAIPLVGLARGFANLATTKKKTDFRANSCRRIVSAMIAHPFMVSVLPQLIII